MNEERDFLEEIMKEYLEVMKSIEKMEQKVDLFPGCIIRKGSRKQYYYWQRIINGKIVQEYLEQEKVEKTENYIRLEKWKKERIKEKKRFLIALGKMLRAVGIHKEDILKEYEALQEKKKHELYNRQIAMQEAGKKKYAENYRHLTDKGEAVASKSELIIANILYAYGIKYEYERPITINGVTYKPDFTIWRPDGTMILWEHAGLMDDPEYARKFEQKLIQYQSAGFTQAVNLIVTYDDNGSFTAVEVRRMLELYKLI